MPLLSLVPWFSAWSSAIPVWLLLVGACLGHGYFMVVGLNVLYSCALPHVLLKVARKIDFLAILAGPVLFLIAFGFPGPLALDWQGYGPRTMLAFYTLFCFVLGLGVAPV